MSNINSFSTISKHPRQSSSNRRKALRMSNRDREPIYDPDPDYTPTNLDLAITVPSAQSAYAYESVPQLKRLLKLRGISTKQWTIRQDFVDRLIKSHTQAVVYEGYSKDELLIFIKTRRLRLTSDRQVTLAHVSKQTIIASLERADRHMTFPILQLPVELQTSIWKYSVVASDTITHSAQPPVTRASKEIRGPALNVYYRLNRFLLTIHPSYLDSQMFNLPYHPSPWLQSICPENLASIRQLELGWGRVTLYHHNGDIHPRIHSLRVTLTFNKDVDNLFSLEMGMRSPAHGEADRQVLLCQKIYLDPQISTGAKITPMMRPNQTLLSYIMPTLDRNPNHLTQEKIKALLAELWLWNYEDLVWEEPAPEEGKGGGVGTSA